MAQGKFSQSLLALALLATATAIPMMSYSPGMMGYGGMMGGMGGMMGMGTGMGAGSSYSSFKGGSLGDVDINYGSSMMMDEFPCKKVFAGGVVVFVPQADHAEVFPVYAIVHCIP